VPIVLVLVLVLVVVLVLAFWDLGCKIGNRNFVSRSVRNSGKFVIYVVTR
jgi:hypothetical protein